MTERTHLQAIDGSDSEAENWARKASIDDARSAARRPAEPATTCAERQAVGVSSMLFL
jgi:hypothetical protein